MQLLDVRTPDGSRHFACIPQKVGWAAVCWRALELPGMEKLNEVAEGLTRPWLDFRFRGHRFLVESHGDCFCLFVRDPQCPDLVLYQVGRHFEEWSAATHIAADADAVPRSSTYAS